MDVCLFIVFLCADGAFRPVFLQKQFTVMRFSRPNRFIRNVYFSTLLFFLSLPAGLWAMHIIGGELTYEYLGEFNGNNRYRFTMFVYRDCNSGGAPLDNNANIAVYRGTYSNNVLFTTYINSNAIPLSSASFIPIEPPPCVQNVPNVCVQQGKYVFTKDLPISNQSYFIVYQRCCRNNTISNILTPGDVGATYFVEITPLAQQVKSSSPVFNDFPPIVICNRVPLEFDHSAADPDGDNLVYSFCSPFMGGGSITNGPLATSCDGATPIPPCAPPFDNVAFVVPDYSPGNPMGGNPQVTIDPLTGLITGTPNMLGQFVVGVCVQEFRNGQLLSTVRRDFQFNVADCDPTVLAKLNKEANNGGDTLRVVGQKYFIRSCGAKTLTLENLSEDPAFIKSFRWEFDFGGTVYKDSVNWDPTVTFPDTGRYVGALILNPGDPCADTAFITVDIFPKVNADFSYDYDTCVAGPVVFTDLSSNEGGVTLDRWRWSFGVPGGVSTIQSPEFLYPYPGNHPVRLRVYDIHSCWGESTETIQWYPVPPLIIIQPSSFLGCLPAEIFFNNLSSPIDSTYQIVWDFGDGTTVEDVISPSHLYDEEGLYDVSVAITSPLGCFTADTFPRLIRVEPSPIADFSMDPSEGLSNLNNTVQFTDLSQGAAKWNWQFDRYATVTEQNPSFTFPDTGRVGIRLIVTHPRGCKDSLTRYLDIRPETRWFMPNAFTPNGDGQNDGFYGKGFLEGVSDFRMTIWNRWGELVYETENPADQWNGRAGNTGGMSPAGVYVYLVTFTEPRGVKREYRGFVTLVQ